MELEEEDGEDQCSDLEKDAQHVALRNMSSPEEVKDLVGATKYFNWIREKETANKVVKAKKSVLCKKKCQFIKRLLCRWSAVQIWMLLVTRITCLVMMRVVERMRR